MRFIVSLLISAAIVCGAAAHAHHSSAANFVTDRTAVIEGLVKEFWFANPHSRLYVDVTTESGGIEEWMIEGNSRNNLIRRGWSQEKLQPGMAVTVTGRPSRDGSPAMEWELVVTQDGEELER